MEPIQNNSFVTPTSSPVPPTQPEPKRNIFIRILRILGIAICAYVVIGFTLVMINPLFALVVLYPVFAVQSMFGQVQNSALERNLEKIPESSIVMAAELTVSDCVGLFGTEGFMNNSYPGISEYAQKLKVNGFDTVGVCKTAKGTFVAKSSYENGGETRLNQVFIDDNGELKKLIEFGDTVVEFAGDDEGNVFLLIYKDVEGHVSRQPFVYDVNSQAFLKVTQTPDVFEVCSMLNKDQCTTWRVRNFPPPAKANYDPDEQQKEYEATNPKKQQTAAQLECIKEFNKESSRSSGNLGNIKLISDLSEDPLYSCVTDKTKRPYDFDLYAKNALNGGNSHYAFFQTSGNRVLAYHISYPGFYVFNYALDSVSYQVFKNLIAGKYKVGELMPELDNNESRPFEPHSGLSSIDKTTYKNVDVYSIKSSSRFKAFLLGKTYILVRYDSHSNAAISEDTATRIVQSIIDSSPYVPVKGQAPASITYSSTPVKVTTDKIYNSTLDLSSIGFGRAKFVDGESQSGQNTLAIGSIGLSPNDSYAIARISVEDGTPPWDIHIAIIRMTQNGPEILGILTPKNEISRDLIRDGRNTNAHFNADWSVSDDSSFGIRYYDTSTESGPNVVQYTYNYEIQGSQVVKK